MRDLFFFISFELRLGKSDFEEGIRFFVEDNLIDVDERISIELK